MPGSPPESQQPEGSRHPSALPGMHCVTVNHSPDNPAPSRGRAESNMTARERADRLLVARGFYESRARAQAAIAAGLVTANGVLIRRASDAIPTTADIE